MSNEITIFLTPQDVELFKQFQKYHELFNLMVEKRVFDQKGAAITLHFDPQGTLKTIQRADILYSSVAKFDNTNDIIHTTNS